MRTSLDFILHRSQEGFVSSHLIFRLRQVKQPVLDRCTIFGSPGRIGGVDPSPISCVSSSASCFASRWGEDVEGDGIERGE